MARIEGIPVDERDAFAVEMFGGTRDLDGLAAMRLSEHAVHTWDIAVALDPEATVSPEAVDLIVDTLPATASRAAKAGAERLPSSSPPPSRPGPTASPSSRTCRCSWSTAWPPPT